MRSLEQTWELDVPETRANIDPSRIDLRPRKVADWIEALPWADIGEVGQRLAETLALTNRAFIPAHDRYKFLEQLNPAVDYVLAGLARKLSTLNIPLTPKGRRLHEQAQTLLHESAIGYQHIVVELARQRRRIDRKRLAHCIQRAMDRVSDELLNAYRLYIPSRMHTWRDLHRLYAIAEQYELVGLAAAPLRRPSATGATIDNTYTGALLLAAADPYHLRRGEVDRVATLVRHWTQQLNLSLERQLPPEPELAALRVRLDWDQGPLRIAERGDSNAGEHDRFLVLSYLVAALRDADKAGSGARRDSAGLGRGLVRRLIVTLEGHRQRKYKRTTSQASAEVTVGLNATHQLLENGGADMEWAAAPSEPAAPVAPIGLFSRDAAKMTILSADGTPVRGHTTTIPGLEAGVASLALEGEDADPEHLPEPKYAAANWSVEDISAGGYRLRWVQDTPCPARVGDVVSIREDRSRRGAMLGVVRWMQHLWQGGLLMGVQIVAAEPRSVSARVDAKPTAAADSFKCLELPAIRAVGQPSTLMAPPQRATVGSKLTLMEAGQRKTVRLTRLVEHTGNFSLFQFEPVDNTEQMSDASVHPSPLGSIPSL